MTKPKVKNVRFRNDRLRLKLTDQCNLRCPFCHYEGARKTAPASPDDPLLGRTLRRLKNHYRIVWLTGGEPTLYENLPEMIGLIRDLGYEADMTSNGVFDLDRVGDSLARLGWLNISFHSLSPVYVRKLVPRGSDVGRTIDIIRANIAALKSRVPLAINAVVGREDEGQRIRDIHEYAREEQIPLKLVPDWRCVDEARRLILRFLREEKYRLGEVVHIHPGSNVRKVYFNGDRTYKVEFKDIVP
ncbi:MAG: radical SAM protein, partial [Candidatus Aminicenantes bacterium]|nr:radical SAM protein [Candidatus Aminicenantes bacterium]